ncbi:MAG: DNA methyltransferase [Desulfobacterales bacterium]
MMGGGTTLHEAIRMGANVVGADIDPIPVLQARATLTQMPLKTLAKQFGHFFDSLCEKIGQYYRTACPVCQSDSELRFVLYGIRRNCGCREAVFVDSYALRHNSDGSQIHICPDTYNILHNNQIIRKSVPHCDLPLLEKKDKTCFCGKTFCDDISLPYYQRHTPVALSGKCREHVLFFSAPQQSDLDLISLADSMRTSLDFDKDDFGIQSGPKSSDLIRRGIYSYLDLFSGRQFLFLHTAIGELQQVEYPANLKFAMLVSTSLEFNSMLCGYKGVAKYRVGAIRHTFTHHAYSFPCTALENNPVSASKSSGTLCSLFHSRLVRGHTWAMRPVERCFDKGQTGKMPIPGERDSGREHKEIADLKQSDGRFLLILGSSANLDLPDRCVDHIVTDPPYFDSVQYTDLAAFFRVWLRKMLPSELCQDYAGEGAAVESSANGQYESVLKDIFSECHRVLKDGYGRLIFTFHHWNPKAWAGLAIALKHADFRLINRYVIHSENPASVHIVNQNSLIHDVILLLAKAGNAFVPQWEFPENINKNNSRTFCSQCSVLLGCLLNSTFTDNEIHQIWSDMI